MSACEAMIDFGHCLCETEPHLHQMTCENAVFANFTKY